MNACDLTSKQCKPCEGGTPPLSQPEIDKLLPQLPGWQQYDRIISKTYTFKNYYQTIAFVNAVAWLSHREDHHPSLGVSYKECRVEYTTHAITGLSENDFICAAKVEALIAP
jgi:4a-hydroxytetrahydrobiopterin dehydratase